MKKAVLLISVFTFLAATFVANAQPTTEAFATLWERGIVDTAADDTRDLGVSKDNGYMVTIDRISSALEVYQAVPGQPDVFVKDMSTSGISTGLYALLNGGFSEDGAFFACSLDVVAGWHLYYWSDINADPVEITPGPDGQTRMGDALDVIGRVDDNSVKVITTGSSAGVSPLVFTTADNGATWGQATLAGVANGVDIQWDPADDGSFWAVASGGEVTHYDSAASSLGTLTGSTGEFACAADGNGLVYTIGIKANAVIKAWDANTGALLTTHDDPIDDFGGLGDFGTANGSCSLDVTWNPGSGNTNIYATAERYGAARYVYGTEVVVDGVGAAYPNYASVQDAIDSYHSGGQSTGTTTTQPLIISVDPYNGPYVGGMELDDGNQPLVGDLLIRSAVTTGVLAQLTVTADGGGDGIRVTQDEMSVIFQDILFHTDIANNIVDDWFEVWDGPAAGVADWFELIGCIVTASNTSGDPLVTTRNDAFVAPVDKADATAGSFNYVVNASNSGNEAQHVNIDNTVIYGHGANGTVDHAVRFSFEGVDHKGFISNSVIAYNGASGVRFSTGLGYGAAILGDDARSGTDNCTVLYNNGYHTIWLSAGNPVLDLKNTILDDEGGNRNISGAATSANMDIDDCMLVGAAIPILSDQSADVTWSRNTFDSTSLKLYAWNNDSAGVTVTVEDCVFSGGGGDYGIQGSGAWDAAAVNCGFASTVSRNGGFVSDTNPVDFDPVYQSTDTTSADAFDVRDGHYAAAATGGADLAGGADYVGGSFSGIDLAITELMDGSSNPTGFHRYCEITNVGSVDVDLSEVALGNANNGASTFSNNVTDLATQTGVATLAPGESIVLTDDATNFNTIYGFNADTNTSALFVNGDDVVALLEPGTDNAIDVYGVLGVDGSGEAWEYTDTRANRLTPVAANLGIFDVAAFDLAVIDDLDGVADADHARIGSPRLFNPNMVFAQQSGLSTDLDEPTTPALTFAPSVNDLLTSDGVQFTLGGLGLHGAATGGVAIFSDGIDNGSGLGFDGLFADANGVGQPSTLSVDFEAELGNPVAIDQINMWSANYTGQDARAFINCHIYIDETDDATFNPTFYGEVTTGAKGASNTGFDFTSAYITDATGYLSPYCFGVQLDFYSVTNAGTEFRHEGLGGGGSIVKEVDIFGTELYVPTSVGDTPNAWMVFE